MKSLFQIFITLSLIIFSICADDCSGKSQQQCTGTCSWTAGKAATCTVTTCALNDAKNGCEPTADCTFTQGAAGADGTCASKAATCTVSGDTCNPAEGCKYNAATQGTCATKSETNTNPNTDTTNTTNKDDGTSKLKISLISSLLIFLF